jgi:hypothetical protein
VPLLTLVDTLCQGSLSIAGVSMHGPAWDVVDLVPLWRNPAKRGGPNRAIPGISGRVPYPRRVDETAHALPFLVHGEVNRLGVPQANPWAGLQANLDYLWSNVIIPTGLTDGTRAATLTMPDGTTRTAAIIVEGLTPGGFVKYVRKFTLDIIIPAGMFV